jgi:hydrogenase nickel incorporation protein HypB
VSDVLLINKMDYLEISDFNLGLLRERALKLNPRIQIFEISAKTGQGVDRWAGWLSEQVQGVLR